MVVIQNIFLLKIFAFYIFKKLFENLGLNHKQNLPSDMLVL